MRIKVFHDAAYHFLDKIKASARGGEDSERIIVLVRLFGILFVGQVVGPFPIAVRKTWPTKP